MWLLGGFGVSVGARTIGEGEWRLRKARGLVKLLALAPGHRLHRERVMDLLWPDLVPAAAANNLRHAVYVARRAFGDGGPAGPRYMVLENGELRLCPGGRLRVDVDAFEEAAGAANRSREPAVYRRALALYTGELLPEDRYEGWSEDRRQELRGAYLSLLAGLAGCCGERGETGPAVEALRRLLREDPACEEAHLDLMRLYAASGRKGEALVQYDRLREVLAQSLGIEPGTVARRLYDEVREDRVPSLPAESFPGPPNGAAPDDRHNLPAARTSFVGREDELARAERALAMTQLLTLTGAGGCGKTRLALEIARDLKGSYRDGVWLVELASISEAALVPRAVARAVGVREQPGRPLSATLAAALREKQMLLVLDNCEHLVDAAASLVDGLLAGCPRLRVLATGREPLGIAGETDWRVPSLSVPDRELARRLPAVEEAEAYEAVRLFVDRARRRRRGFALTPENAGCVSEVCRRLDGIPLAIELAAARVGALEVGQISSRLGDVLGFLTDGSRTAPPRQRTLCGAVGWSYDLLGGPEKTLFARLSAFAGGWTLGAAETVGAGDSGREEVLDLLSRLVDKSLVVLEPEAGDTLRYRMLEPLRQYAAWKLEEDREADAVRRRHAELFLQVAEAAEQGSNGPEHASWMRRLETEHDNLRAALRWLLDGGEAGLCQRLAAALWGFWHTHGHLAEGRGWLEAAASLDGPAAARAEALTGAGYLALSAGDFEAAKGMLEEARDLHRELGDEQGVATALTYLGFVGLVGERGDVPVEELLEEVLEIEPRITRRRTAADLLTLVFAAAVTGVAGKSLDGAAALHEEALARFARTGNAWGTGTCLANLGLMAAAGGDAGRAEALFGELMEVSRQMEDKMAYLYACFGLACVAAAEGRHERAARLWGVTEAAEETSGIRLPPVAHHFVGYEERVAGARAGLGEAAFESAWATGKALPQPAALEYALAADPPPERPVEPDSPLTRREKEVAALVARGLTNRRISSELFVSERTVDTHVARILKKLGLNSRRQVEAHPLPGAEGR